MNKKSFSLLELIFIIILITIITSFSFYNINQNKLLLAKKQIILHLKYMRYIALLDNKFDHTNTNWYRESWNLKFRWCNGKDKLHYYIYSDKDNNGHVKEDETLIDPLTNNHIYSTTKCQDNINRTNYTLLSKYYNISKVEISCNQTNSLGQILFLNTGIASSKFVNNVNMNKYTIKDDCYLKLFDSNRNESIITITANTGYIY
jgi:Tfp pilus assembly protein FimT